jgi:hypothetical protein
MTNDEDIAAIRAQAHIHHAYLLGLQLMVSTRKGPDVVGDWMFRLFRRQHLEKFRSGFAKLGLEGLPDAVACARYHVLSNAMGGVAVEYMVESDAKAWVRFRYPRWMYDGPTLCGVPVGASRGFLEGWYAHNGVTLGNPRLGFVCVSEDMTGEFGLCGYFREFERALRPEERLQFARGELPPPFDPSAQPAPPPGLWNASRLEKARRNYALDFIRGGICSLAEVIGEPQTRELGSLAARLIGLQYFQATAALIDARDGGPDDAADYLCRMFAGMGDAVERSVEPGRRRIVQRGLRAVRGMNEGERALMLACWTALWQGAMASQRAIKRLEWEDRGDCVAWTLTAR